MPSLSGQKQSNEQTNDPKHKFVLHWLNNKEMEFTVQAEKIMEDLLKMALERDDVSDEAFEYELTHPDKNTAEEALDVTKKVCLYFFQCYYKDIIF